MSDSEIERSLFSWSESLCWKPARRGQLSQKSVRVFALLFGGISRESPRDSGPHWNLSHRWRRKGLSARQRCFESRIRPADDYGPQNRSSSDLGQRSSLAHNLRQGLLCHYSSVVGRTAIFRPSTPLHAKKPKNCLMKWGTLLLPKCLQLRGSWRMNLTGLARGPGRAFSI